MFWEKYKALVEEAKEYIEKYTPSENITYYKDLNADEGPAEWMCNYLSIIKTTDGRLLAFQRKDFKEASEEEIIENGTPLDLSNIGARDIIDLADLIAKSRGE